MHRSRSGAAPRVLSRFAPRPPNLYLHLARAVDLQGPLGLRRRSDCVGMRVDDPGALEQLLRVRCGQAG